MPTRILLSSCNTKPDCNLSFTQVSVRVPKSDNMFAKNYHHNDASNYTTVPYPDQDDDVVFSWEFFTESNYSVDPNGFFEGTSEINLNSGSINTTEENSTLAIPPHSIVQVIYEGISSLDDCAELNNDELFKIDGFKLNEVYPNPFNPITTIAYQIPEYGNVRIDIYNINGQLVENLYEGIKTPGLYTLNWNARNFSSGVYIVKMISGEFIQTQKLMLIK